MELFLKELFRKSISYRWEEVAAASLNKNPELLKQLEAKKAAEPEFAKNAGQILNWVYRNSPYFEPSFMRYPVYRILQTSIEHE